MADPKSPLGNKLKEIAGVMQEEADTLRATGVLGPIAVKGVSEAELNVAFQGPALLSNRFYGSVSQGGLRLTFCEDFSAPRQSVFRTAVFLQKSDAYALKELLEQMLEDLEAKNATDPQKPSG